MSPIRLGKIEDAMRTVLAFNDAFNRHDVSGMMQFMSPDCVFENTSPAPDGSVYTGHEAVARFWRDLFRDAPHARIKIEEVFGLGDRCVMRWVYSWGGRADEHVRGVDVFRVSDGLIREKYSYVKG